MPEDGSGSGFGSDETSEFIGSPGWIAMIVVTVVVVLACCLGIACLACCVHNTEFRKNSYHASQSRAQKNWAKATNVVKVTNRLSRAIKVMQLGNLQQESSSDDTAPEDPDAIEGITPVVPRIAAAATNPSFDATLGALAGIGEGAASAVAALTGPDSAAESEAEDKEGTADAVINASVTTMNPSFDPFGGSTNPTNPEASPHLSVESTGDDDEAAPAPAAVAGTGPTLAPVLDATTPVQTPAATTAPTPIAEAAPTEHATTAAPTAITAELAPTHVATEVPPLPAAPTEAAAEEPRKIPAPKPSTTSAPPVAAPAPGNENETVSASKGTEVLVDPPQPTAPPTPMPVEEVPTPAVVQVANPPQAATVHAPVLAEAGAAPASAPAPPAPTVDATPPEPTPKAEGEAAAAPPVQAMWAAAEQDANGLLSAGVVANILSSSGLTQKVLRTVWSSAKKKAVVKSGGSTMNQTEFTEAVSLAIAAGGVFAD